MAKDLLITDGDIVRLDNGDFAFVEDIDEMAQSVRVELSTPRGTHVTDENFGFPYRDLVFKKSPNTSEITGTAKSMMQARSDVLRAFNVSTVNDFSTRINTLTMSLETTQGLLDQVVVEI